MQGINDITEKIIGAAIKVHQVLGPGLLESAYEACLLFELRKRGLEARSQVILPIIYEGESIDAGYRLDLLIENSVIVEIKAVEKTLPIHEAQIISYLRLSGKKVGLLMNFHQVFLKDGLQRFVDDYQEDEPK